MQSKRQGWVMPFDRSLKTLQLVEQFPEAWHPLSPEIRRCRLRRFPYSMVCTQDGPDILVLAIAHRHRKPSYWKHRRG